MEAHENHGRAVARAVRVASCNADTTAELALVIEMYQMALFLALSRYHSDCGDGRCSRVAVCFSFFLLQKSRVGAGARALFSECAACSAEARKQQESLL
jgi:hypothetical protein